MRQTLVLHPDSRCDAVTCIEVDVTRPQPSDLVLHYFVTGRISDLSIPPVCVSARADELWRHTCFEVFVRTSPNAAYYEFNFASSTQWAAYRFDTYRDEMRTANEIGAPQIESMRDEERFELRAQLKLEGVYALPNDAAWRLGLSAVIEETNGRKSYWALAHPPGQPDFHHSDCFALELPAA